MPGGAEQEHAPDTVAAIPAPRAPLGDVTGADVTSADVLRGFGLDALVELVESSGYGICVTGDEHTWEYVNPAGTRTLGRPFSELRGRDYLLHFPEHERAALLALESDQREGDTAFYTNTVVRPDGTEVRMTWSGSVMHAAGRELAPAIFHEAAGARRAHADAPTLGSVSGRIAAGEPAARVLSALVGEAVAATRASAGLLLVEEDGGLRVAARTGLSAALDEAVAASGARLADLPSGPFLGPGAAVHFSDDGERIASSPRTATWPGAAGVPWQGAAKVGVRGPHGLVGCLVVLLPPEVTAPDEVELALWSALADQAAVALADEELRRQASWSAARLERQRIARDLHDSVSQALFSLHARAGAVRRALDAGDSGLVREAAGDLETLSRQAVAEMRQLLVELRPRTVAEDGGLVHALGVLAASVRAREGLAVEVRCSDDVPDLRGETAEHLYRIAREAVHNTVKHAAAASVEIRLAVEGAEVVLALRDDGCGFAVDRVPEGRHGQRTMRERAELCGGTVRVTSSPGVGTTVVARVPRPPAGAPSA